MRVRVYDLRPASAVHLQERAVNRGHDAGPTCMAIVVNADEVVPCSDSEQARTLAPDKRRITYLHLGFTPVNAPQGGLTGRLGRLDRSFQPIVSITRQPS